MLRPRDLHQGREHAMSGGMYLYQEIASQRMQEDARRAIRAYRTPAPQPVQPPPRRTWKVRWHYQTRAGVIGT